MNSVDKNINLMNFTIKSVSFLEEAKHLSRGGQQDYLLILEALYHNNQKAYTELMNKYWDYLYFFLLKKTNNSCVAEDLTIEAFSKAFENLGNYNPTFAFSTWLFKIATNNCIDFLRLNKINAVSLDVELENEDLTFERQLVSETHNPEEFLIRKEQLFAIKEILKDLKFRYYKLIDLYYFQQLSYMEIANKYNLPLGTVKAQIFRAKIEVKKLLERKTKSSSYYRN